MSAHTSKLVGGLILSTTLSSVSSFAQTEAADGEDTPVQGQLTEIVVTAQRREQNMQDTPVAVSAFDAESLKASGVTNLQELSHVAPSLQVSSTAGVYLPFLRGVGNNNGTVGNESSVATYIDDVYYTRLSTAYLALGNIQRIEVLNGPQGTLFGRNSSGGAIQMFTRDPSQQAEFNASMGYANYDTVSAQLYASIPLTDTLSWNIAFGGSDQRVGWGKSRTTGQDANLAETFTVRTKLLWEPSDRTMVKIVGFYADSTSDIGSVQDFYEGTYGATPAGGFPGYPAPPALLTSFKEDSDTFYDNRLNARNDATEEGYGGSIRIDQDVGFAELVSISAFRRSEGNYHVDLDYSERNFYHADLGNMDDQVTQEFQLRSKPGAISWMVGTYYLHWKAGYDPATAEGDLFNILVAPGTIYSVFGIQTVDSYSGYAQATVPIGDQTNVTLGARYTEDEMEARGRQTYTIPGVGVVSAAPPGLPDPYTDSAKPSAFTYRAAIDHHFTDDVMAYASVSRGYKSGAFNTLPLATPAARPETVQAYEIGFKSEPFDRRVRINGAAFWSDIENPQVLTTVTTGVLSAVSLTNAQRARSRGAEIAVEAVPVVGLTLRSAATYLDAEYTEFDNAPFFSGGLVPGSTISGPVLGDASGFRMANVPEWRFDAGANYNWITGVGEWVGDIGVSYTGAYPWTADNRLRAEEVTLVNASLRFTPSSMDWMSFSVWGKNLGDVQYYLIGQETAGPVGTGGYVTSPAAPRTYGFTVSVEF
ncbi:MAG TPA: TonB-dependent receptor [Steroidobacter sp.]|uniref:TonB-dependent receptor n=1 Tax=Steroidobacter sp. TaxID=1978227 RepID=UPI002ED939C3